MSGAGQWGSSAASGRSGTQTPSISRCLSTVGGALSALPAKFGSSLVPFSGKGTERGGRLGPCNGTHNFAHFALART